LPSLEAGQALIRILNVFISLKEKAHFKTKKAKQPRHLHYVHVYPCCTHLQKLNSQYKTLIFNMMQGNEAVTDA